MTATNRDIVGDKCVRNNGGNLTDSDYGKHLAWKDHCHRMLNEEFEQNQGSLSVNCITGPYHQIFEESVRKNLHQMKKDKASGTSVVVSKMQLASGDLGTERMTNLINKIIAENKVPKN